MKKIKNKIADIVLTFKYFGIKIAFLSFCKSFLFRKKNTFGKKIEIKYNLEVKKYIKDRYSDIIKKYKNENIKENSKIEMNCPIWIFWWQGLENAPEVVKVCIKNNKKYLEKHKINIITESNIEKYFTLPSYIVDKFKKGNISITHLSDILRVNLLYTYGGIWIDSTVFLTNSLNEDIYNYSFYSIHHNKRSDYHICKGLWSTFFIASSKNNQIVKYLADMFDSYMQREEKIISYLLIDFFIAIGYEEFEWMHDIIDTVPINNEGTFEMAKNFNTIYTEKLYEELSNNTYIHKLSYKIKTDDNLQSLYNKIIKTERRNNEKRNTTSNDG